MNLSHHKKKDTLNQLINFNYENNFNKGESIEIIIDKIDNSKDLNKSDKLENNSSNEIKNEIYRTNIINDQPYGEDFLGYDKYARALSYILLSEHIDLPLSVGIFSSWGTGKTFLLKRIEHKIKELVKRDHDKKVIIVNFNAWEYSGADVLWAGLVKNIYDATEKKFTQCQTRFFRHIIYPFRERNKKQIIWFVLWWIIRILLTLSSIIFVSTIHMFAEHLAQTIASFTLLGVSLFAILPSIIKSIIGLCKNQGIETMKSAKNIENKVGFMADVKRELEILCDFMKYKNNYKFIVFVDDLDRCPPKQIVKILDAIMLLLSNKDFPFLTFLALDPRIIISSIESSFKKDILNSGINGFEYIDKLIQIPFCIPITSPATKKEIMEILTRDKVELLNNIINKVVIFVEKYNLYDIININRSDTNKNNIYKSKVKIIQAIFIFLHKKFGNLEKDKYKRKKNNYIYTLQEKCQFINKVLSFIDNKLENQIETKNGRNSKRYNFANLEAKMIELEEIVNYRPKLRYSKTLDNIPIDIKEDTEINNIKTKFENKNINDEEILIYGNYLIENENIGIEEIIKFKEYLLKVIDVYTMWSPYKTELDTLLVNIEESIEKKYKLDNNNNLKDKIIIKSFTKEEIDYLNNIYIYLDGNCRRNKRIINIFSISKYIMGNRINGWYSNKVVNLKLKTKLIKLIVLAEQWVYRLSLIFQKMEDYRQMKINIMNNNKKTNNSKDWININGNINIIDIYKSIDRKIIFHKQLDKFFKLDYDPDVFLQFMCYSPKITVNDFYLLIPYLFNINLYIKNKIAEVSDKIRFNR